MKEIEKNTLSEKPRTHLFQPGVSGNPAGRPKRTKEQAEAMAEIRKLAPSAVDHMVKLLNSGRTPAAVKVKIIEIILDRTYGKAPSSVNISSDAGRIEASRSFILSLVQSYQADPSANLPPAATVRPDRALEAPSAALTPFLPTAMLPEASTQTPTAEQQATLAPNEEAAALDSRLPEGETKIE